MKKIFLSLALCSIVLACQDDVKIPIGEIGKITSLQVGFVTCENSRVTINGLASSFEPGDAIGVFGEYIDNAKFVVTEDLRNAQSNEECLIRTGEKLFAYYPYVDGVTKDYTSTTGIKVRTFPIEVSRKQKQTDAEGTHVTMYDYMVGIPVVVSDENTQILFNRINSWLEFKICNEEDGPITVKSVTVESEYGELVYKGIVDVLAVDGDSYMSVQPTQKTEKFTILTEGNWSTVAPGDDIVVRAAILPYDYSGVGLIISVETDKGISRMRYQGMNFKPGNVYTMTMSNSYSANINSNVK